MKYNIVTLALHAKEKKYYELQALNFSKQNIQNIHTQSYSIIHPQNLSRDNCRNQSLFINI